MDNKNLNEINARYTLYDEDDNPIDFLAIGRCEYKGAEYYAMIPADSDVDATECEYVVLKMIQEDGEDMLITIDDDDEFDDVADIFDDMFTTDLDYDQPPKNPGKK